tara:strand:+ start:1389 stop:1613 length:225 start_codon:yes stop_codon:yes gene_type:complete
MIWLTAEIEKSDKGNMLNAVNMLEYELQRREIAILESISRKVINKYSELMTCGNSVKYTKSKLNSLFLEEKLNV